MFAFWSSPNQIPIKSRGPFKKTSHVRPIYLASIRVWSDWRASLETCPTSLRICKSTILLDVYCSSIDAWLLSTRTQIYDGAISLYWSVDDCFSPKPLPMYELHTHACVSERNMQIYHYVVDFLVTRTIAHKFITHMVAVNQRPFCCPLCPPNY